MKDVGEVLAVWFCLSQLHTVSLGMYQHSPPLPLFRGPTSLNFSTAPAPKPLCFHNEFGHSDLSFTVFLSLIIKNTLQLRTFVRYCFNGTISMSPWWPLHSSVIISFIMSCNMRYYVILCNIMQRAVMKPKIMAALLERLNLTLG